MSFEYLKKKKIIWIGGIVISILGIVSDIIGGLTPIWNFLNPIREKKVSLLLFILFVVVLMLLLLFVVISYLYLKKRSNRQKSESRSIGNQGQFLAKLQRMIVASKNNITIIGLDKDWIFPLIISIYIARSKDVSVDVIPYNVDHFRYKLLEYLGCNVYKANPPFYISNFSGVLVDSENILSSRAIIYSPREGENVRGRYYYGSLDYYAIKSSFLYACQIRGNATKYLNETNDPEDIRKPFIPSLIEVSVDLVIQKLRNVVFYKSSNIIFNEVKIKDTLPSSKYLVTFKLNQIEELIRLYEEKSWVLFRPCGIKLKNGEVSLIVPPILEEHNGNLYVVEGHSRLYYLLEKGETKVRAFVVKGVKEPLPLSPTTWGEIIKVDENPEVRKIELARYIETSTHREVWHKDALEHKK